MSEPTPNPPPGADAASWLKYIPMPMRWLIGTAAGFYIFSGFIPPAALAFAWSFASTPAGLSTLFVASIGTAVGMSAKMFEKPMNELRAAVHECHVAKAAERTGYEQKLNEQRDHYESKFRRLIGVLLLYTKGDGAKAHEETLRLLGE